MIIIIHTLGCLVQTALFLVLLGASICSVFAMTAHKYLSIVYQWQLTERHVSAMILVSWLFPFLLLVGFSRTTSNSSNNGIVFIGLVSTKHYCFSVLYVDDLVVFIGAIIILTFITGTIIMLVLAHAHILMKYREWKRTGRNVRDRLRKEGILIKKSMAIAGIFTLQWTFYIAYILYELASHKPVSLGYELFWEFLGVAIPILNLVILYVYDAKFKQNIITLRSYPRSVFEQTRKRLPIDGNNQMVEMVKVEQMRHDTKLDDRQEGKDTVLVPRH